MINVHAQDSIITLPKIPPQRTCMVQTENGMKQMYYFHKGGKASIGTGKYGQAAIDTTVSGRFVIPDSVLDTTGKMIPVKRISRAAFAHCSKLTEVVMPDYIEDIGDQAFYDCSSLRYLKLPPKLEVIYPYAFRGCSSLSIIQLTSPKGPAVYDNIFDQETLNHATLFIPFGTSKRYADSFIWGLFLYRMELPE